MDAICLRAHPQRHQHRRETRMGVGMRKREAITAEPDSLVWNAVVGDQ